MMHVLEQARRTLEQAHPVSACMAHGMLPGGSARRLQDFVRSTWCA